MELIDTHCHLDLENYDPDREEVIERARNAGLVHLITIGIDPDSSAKAIALAEKHEFISATVGHHPHDASTLRDEDLERLREMGRHPQVVGFGEIGLDYFRNISPQEVQRQRFDDLIQIGMELKLPLVIHDRDAHQDILDHLVSAGASRNGGIIHCFSGDYGLARRFLDMGFYISIPGTVTFPKATELREVVARLPMDAILLETDAPFLTPVPKRGRRNEPALVRHTAEEVAKIKGLSLEETARATTANARTAFGIS